MNVRLKQGDTAHKFIDTLLVNGVPFDLTGATVRFIVRKVSGIGQVLSTGGFTADATVTSALTGEVEYNTLSTQFLTIGTYYQEWEVTAADARILTFPNNSWNTIRVIADLD